MHPGDRRGSASLRAELDVGPDAILSVVVAGWLGSSSVNAVRVLIQHYFEER